VAGRRDPADTASRLFSVAEGQGGYFTARQALSAGYGYRLQNYHVGRGNWLKVDRGVFRLRNFPIWDREDLIRWTFWSLGRGVVSHDSALEFHGIGDLIPDQIHLTVPPNFRKRDARVVLHRSFLERSDVERSPGFRVTTPLRTILDVADSDLDSDRFGDAVFQAIRSGRVRPTQLTDSLEHLSERGRRRLEDVLRVAIAA
jgi:predicted transcriptional regulator of viral defense system